MTHLIAQVKGKLAYYTQKYEKQFILKLQIFTLKWIESKWYYTLCRLPNT